MSCGRQGLTSASIVRSMRPHRRRYRAVDEVPPAPVSCGQQSLTGTGIVRSIRPRWRQYRAVYKAMPVPVPYGQRRPTGAGIVQSTRPRRRQYRAVDRALTAPVSSRLRGLAGAGIVRSTGPRRRRYRAVDEAPPAPVLCRLRGRASTGIVRSKVDSLRTGEPGYAAAAVLAAAEPQTTAALRHAATPGERGGRGEVRSLAGSIQHRLVYADTRTPPQITQWKEAARLRLSLWTARSHRWRTSRGHAA